MIRYVLLAAGLLSLTVQISAEVDADLASRRAKYAEEVRLRQRPFSDELLAMIDENCRVTFYSIAPDEISRRMDADGTWGGTPTFRQHVIRRVASINDSKDARKLIQSLANGVSDTDGTEASCFLPVYGLTVERGIKKIDLVICFMCGQVRAYGMYSGSSACISSSPAAVFADVAGRYGLSIHDPQPRRQN